MTAKKKRKPTGPIGGGGARHPNSLANLLPGGTTGSGVGLPLGHTRSLRHGGVSVLAMTPSDRDIAEIIDALSAVAPVRDQDGGLPPVDQVAVEIAARALKRYRSVTTYFDLHGRIDEKGQARAGTVFEISSENALHRALDVLGMNPAARARLGVDLARSASLLDQAESMRSAGDRLRARASEIEATARDGAQAETLEPRSDPTPDLGTGSHPAPSEPQEGAE